MRAGVLLSLALGLALLALGPAAGAEPGLAVEGRVLSASRPLAGARFELLPVLARYEAELRETEGRAPETCAPTRARPWRGWSSRLAAAILAGRVVTARGEPAAGARVTVAGDSGTAEATAGGDGEYRLAGVEPGERTVEASRDDGAWASRRVTVAPGENRGDLTIDQGSPRQESRGRVLGPDGGPVPGAAVLASSAARAFSAGDGTFVLSVEDDYVYDVWAEKEVLAPAKSPVAVRVSGAPVEGIEIRLGRGAALAGRPWGSTRRSWQARPWRSS